MAQLAKAAAPVLRLRGNWTVIDPAVARKARKRLIRDVAPGPAVAAALTGTVEVGQGEAAVDEQVVVGATLLDVRDRLLGAPRPASRSSRPPLCRATLRDYQRQGLTWLVEMTSLGLGACLADDMGLGKTITLIALHLHRAEHGRGGPTLVVCPASLLGNWEAEIARFAPGVPVHRFHGGRRALGDEVAGFVLTTYGTMRRLRRRARGGAVGAGRRRRGPAHQERAVLHGPGAARHPARRADRDDRHPGREQPHRAVGHAGLGDPRAAGQPARLPQAVGGADRVRRRPGRHPSVHRADRPVRAAPAQGRPGDRARAAVQDRDRSPARADPRAGRALRGLRRATRWSASSGPTPPTRRPGAAWCSRCSPASSRSATTRRTSSSSRARCGSPAAPRSSTSSTSCSAPSSPRTERRWSSPSTSRWAACSRRT